MERISRPRAPRRPAGERRLSSAACVRFSFRTGADVAGPPPPAQGLYDPAFEHDACGFGFVVDLKARTSHDIVRKALQVLLNLEHRGASGCEKNTGDGAGLLLQMPHAFLAASARGSASRCPRRAITASAWSSCRPTPAEPRRPASARSRRSSREEGQTLLGWRDVPTDNATLGPTARASQPVIRQIFVGAGTAIARDDAAFERKLYVIRRLVEKSVRRSAIPAAGTSTSPSLSYRTIVYKGMLNADQLAAFYPDLARRGARRGARDGPLALLDQHLPELVARPPVPLHLAQRRDQHAARQHQLDAGARSACSRRRVFGDDLQKILPVIDTEGSRLGDVRQRARAARPRRALAPPRAHDDDPGAVEPARVDEPGEEGLLRVPLLPHGAVGRPGLDRLHRRHPHRRDPRPQRPPAVALLRHARTASSSWPPRSASSTSRPRRSSGKGRLQPGRHVPRRHFPRGGSSPTTRSSSASPPRSRTPAGSRSTS